MATPLDNIRREIETHASNAWARELGYQPVYSASSAARIMIVGQAPGRKAQLSGTPWNDVSGDLLRHWLGVSRDEFYNQNIFALVPMDFYYPGKGKHGDKPPRADFAPLWHPQLLAAMPHISLIILVGSYAQKYYLGSSRRSTLTETVASYRDYLPLLFPIVHPSPLNIGWRKRNPWFEREVVPQLHARIHDIISN